MIFGVLKPEKIWHQQLAHLPTSLVTAAIYLEKSKKSFFNSIIHTYIRLFTLSQKKTDCYPLPTTPEKCHRSTLYVAFLQMLVALKRAGCGVVFVALKRTGCDVWQLECQASNVTASVQSDHLQHGYMLPVLFATDQLHRPLRSAEIQPMS